MAPVARVLPIVPGALLVVLASPWMLVSVVKVITEPSLGEIHSQTPRKLTETETLRHTYTETHRQRHREETDTETDSER